MKIFYTVSFLCVSLCVFAQAPVQLSDSITMLPSDSVGEWNIENDRLYQNDETAGKARMPFDIIQNGIVEFNYNVRYEGGLSEDRHGGFGIHILSNSIPTGEAWGIGESWLLWLNYDENPQDVLAGLSTQVYRSVSNSNMELVAEYDLNFAFEEISRLGITVSDILSMNIPIRLQINTENGEVRFFSPVNSNFYYYFTLPVEGNGQSSGEYAFLRTNGISLSFGL